MVQIIGHRGAPALVPENTIESFRRAIEAGADYLECDVHLTRDSELVVIHDDRVERTTNGKGCVRDLTLEEIKALTIPGSLKIPTLEEVLALDFPLMIELKSYAEGESRRTYDGLVTRLLKTLRDYKPAQEIILEFTFNEYSNELSQTPFKRLNLRPGFTDFDSLSSPHLFAVGVFYRDLTAELVSEAHKRKLKVFSWPRQNEDIEKAILLGLDLLLSDNPAYAIEIARELGQRQ